MVVTELALKCSSVYEQTKAGLRFLCTILIIVTFVCILGRIYIKILY